MQSIPIMHHHCSSSITALAVASFRFWLWSLCRLTQMMVRRATGWTLCQSIVSGRQPHAYPDSLRIAPCGYVRPCDLLCIGNGFWCCSDLCARIVLWCWWPSTLKSLRRVPKSISNEQDSCAGRVNDRMFGNMTFDQWFQDSPKTWRPLWQGLQG